MTTLDEHSWFLAKIDQSSGYLFTWASKLKVPTLFIIDNCDELLHQRKDTFQNVMKNLVRQSQFLKVMLTAKQMTSFLGWDGFMGELLKRLSAYANLILNLCFTCNDRYICSQSLQQRAVFIYKVATLVAYLALICTMSASLTSSYKQSYLICGLKDKSVKFVEGKENQNSADTR